MLVLIVEDDVLILRSLGRALLRDHDIVTASSVQGALEAVTKSVDAVVSDLEFRDASDPWDGVWLLERVAEAHPRARRILLTGASDEQLHAHTGNPAIQVLLRKPVGSVDVLRALDPRSSE